MCTMVTLRVLESLIFNSKLTNVCTIVLFTARKSLGKWLKIN